MSSTDTKKPTQREIAERMGIPQPAVSRWLNGHVMPTRKNLLKLADIMGETPEALFSQILGAKEQAGA